MPISLHDVGGWEKPGSASIVHQAGSYRKQSDSRKGRLNQTAEVRGGSVESLKIKSRNDTAAVPRDEMDEKEDFRSRAPHPLHLLPTPGPPRGYTRARDNFGVSNMDQARRSLAGR